MKVYVLDPFHQAGVAYLRQHADIVRWDELSVREWQAHADGVVVRRSRIGDTELGKAGRLKVIAKQGVGIENIDLEAARRRGVVVCNSPGINSETVAEMSLALGLAVSRRIAEFDRMIRAGDVVERSTFLGVGCWRKTVGVIGMGNIGTHAARKWRGAFEATILGYDPYAPPSAWADLPHERVDSLEELLTRADVVTLHLPLTEETRHLISGRELAMMKPDAILVNVSRGGIVDEQALYESLSSGHLTGAGLDVFEREPPRSTNPLASLRNVVVTPHAAGGTEENQRRSSIAAAKQVIDVLTGGVPSHRLV